MKYIVKFNESLNSSIDLYHCRECNSKTEDLIVKDGLCECPICGTINDVWLEDEPIPQMHIDMFNNFN